MTPEEIQQVLAEKFGESVGPLQPAKQDPWVEVKAPAIADVTPGTISNALTPLREMLGHAVEWNYLTTNPALGVRRPRVRPVKVPVIEVALAGIR